MKIGIPKGLMYSKYHAFAETFFSELGTEIVISPDTNKDILDAGVKLCVDDACLPVKVFHGHAAWLRGRCDAVLIPRFMTLARKKYICPMFCGLPEMIANSVPGMPRLISEPVFSTEADSIYSWSKRSARIITGDGRAMRNAFKKAQAGQKACVSGYNDSGFKMRAALIGHSYNIADRFVNMDLVNKLRKRGIGVVTSDHVAKADIESESAALFKEPFWYFAQQYFGAAVHLCKQGIDGVVYISSFSCGVDSVVIELIRDAVRDIPVMVLKIDEHTGESAFDTRIEAFADMLERRAFDDNRAEDGQYVPCNQGVV